MIALVCRRWRLRLERAYDAKWGVPATRQCDFSRYLGIPHGSVRR